MSQVEQGEHSRSYVYISPCEVRCCCTAAVGLLSTAPGCFRNSQEVRVGIVQIVFRMAHTHAHARTHRGHRSWLSQREDLEVRLLWLPRRAGYKGLGARCGTQIHSCRRQQRSTKTRYLIAPLFLLYSCSSPSSNCLL